MTKLFDMRTGFNVRNILGISDPSVHFIDGQWTMFVGGFNTAFKTNIYVLKLRAGSKITDNGWQFVTAANTSYAQPLIMQPDKTQWDGYGLHSPSYVRGLVANTPVERIYYAGRSSRKITDNTAPYKIGYMERVNDAWKHIDTPLKLAGTTESPNILEPKVEYIAGKWRMRYVTTPRESGKKSDPIYTIMYSESNDGVDGWSQPIELFSRQEGYYDSVMIELDDDSYGMTVTRNSNLYQREPYPNQGIWWLQSKRPGGARCDWTTQPVQLVYPIPGNDWYMNGMCGPSPIISNGRLHVFFSSTTRKTNWFAQALRNVLKLSAPPVPAPYYLAIGRADFTINRPAT